MRPDGLEKDAVTYVRHHDESGSTTAKADWRCSFPLPGPAQSGGAITATPSGEEGAKA
jgi:hypothetical protein